MGLWLTAGNVLATTAQVVNQRLLLQKMQGPIDGHRLCALGVAGLVVSQQIIGAHRLRRFKQDP